MVDGEFDVTSVGGSDPVRAGETGMRLMESAM